MTLYQVTFVGPRSPHCWGSYSSSLALQICQSLGLLNNIFPVEVVLDLLRPFYKFQIFQVIANIVSFPIRLTRVGQSSFYQVLIPLLRIFRVSIFYKTRLLALCSTPANLEGLGFSVMIISLRWFIASGNRVSPLHDLAVQRRFQGSWRGHACMGLGRYKWHFSDFNGKHTHQQGMHLRDHILPL